MSRTRLVVVDQNDLLLEMLRACLGRIEGLEVAGTARSGRAAVTLVEQVSPDVVLLNLTLPDMSGLTALVKMKSLRRARRSATWAPTTASSRPRSRRRSGRPSRGCCASAGPPDR